jgi:hypothetical protein
LTSTTGGDNRFYNNIFIGADEAPAAKPSPWAGFGLWVYDQREFPLFTGGNAYLAGARPYFKESDALKLPQSQQKRSIVADSGSVFLHIAVSPELRKASTQLITTELLGKCKVTGYAYEKADATAVRIDYDYFGRKRSVARPSPGPFESPGDGEVKLKVW